ncbi:MAG: PocR ligand-binding domain-containing protein [Deltaproteobacteria bacterium]|nr:PocR ligand-binding domain-containing protein [Deltaproteobacteria bacterium]
MENGICGLEDVDFLIDPSSSERGAMSDYRLSDMLDLTIIQKMADAHFRAAGMPIGIIDAIDGSILVGSGWQDICVKFHRANPASLQRCRESDNYIKDRLVEGEACHYKCKNGLWDIGMPIVVSGRHLATMFLGQFFYEGEAPDREYFIQLAHQFGFDVDDYLAALNRVPVFSREKVDYILEYDKALVSFIADLAEHALLKIKADEIIRENERKFHAIFDQAYQFLGLLSIDGKLLEANKTALIFAGVEEANVIGKSFWETSWWAHSLELQEEVRLAVQKAAKGEFIRFEATHPAADGNLRHVDFSLKPVTDETGKVLLLISEGRDITEHKRAEEEIKRQAEFLQLLIDAMPYPVFYKDRQGRYLSCNRAFEQFYGILREEIAGKTAYDIAPKELADLYSRTDNELFTHPGTKIYEGCIQSVDGVRHDVIFHKATFEGPNGELAGLVGVIVDITERKHAEKEKQKLQDQLIQAQKMESVGRLAGGVAHDFNNMLTAIIGHAGLAMKRCTPSEAIHAHLKVIEESARRSADLTRQLLAFARKQTIAPKVLDINNTVSGMLKILLRLIGEDIDLVWSPGTGLWQVKIDPSQIDQLLANLCVNARDSIAGVGKVTIETENIAFDEAYCAVHLGFACGEYVMLAVSDNGCGMDKETLPHIFEPFFTTKEMGKGTGLGLATVYGIVRQNNGFINVYSEPDKGTTFKIYLPRFVGEATEPSTESKAETPKGRGETVLLVEDEPVILNMSREMLEQLGYAVLIAGTPGEALRIAKAHAAEIRMLITDVVMPEMNGRDLANLIRDIKPELKCLFTSGYTANVIAHRGVLDEGVNFLPKPFSMKDLAFKVRQALEQE